MAPQSKVNVRTNNKKLLPPDPGLTHSTHERLPGALVSRAPTMEGSRYDAPIPVFEAPGEWRSATGTFSCGARKAGMRGGVCCVETCRSFVSF